MAEQLTVLELPDFKPSASQSESDGVDPEKVARACAELEEYVTNLGTFIENMIDKKEQIVQGWEGQAKEVFNKDFPELVEAFREIPECVQSIVEWASSFNNIMVSIDETSTEGFETIFGGTEQ